MRLQAAESDALDIRIAAVEARTGVQVLAAVVPRSDSYLELPWKAFALGAALAALGVALADRWTAALAPALAILGAAAASALLAVFGEELQKLAERRVDR